MTACKSTVSGMVQRDLLKDAAIFMNSLGIVRLEDKSKFIVIIEDIFFHVVIDKSIILLVFYFYEKVYRLQRKEYARKIGLSQPQLAEYSLSSFL